MEINFDRYSGNFNANISFGDTSTSITYDGLGVIQEGAILDYSTWMQRYNNDGGPSFTGVESGPVGGISNIHWEHIPISFYNSWGEESKYVTKVLDGSLPPYDPSRLPTQKPFAFDDESEYTIFHFQDSAGKNDSFVEVHHPHDSLHVHGKRWNANSFTFPRDVAHPYLANSQKWPSNFSVGVARPHISCYQMQYDKTKNINHYILEPGPISLSRFYDACGNANWPINLWHFAPEWNNQFDPGYGYNTMISVPLYTNNTTQANQWRAIEHFRGNHSLPMEINYEYPNNMVVPWLRDVSHMFANNAVASYKQRIEIPCFISNASGMFNHGWVHTFINSQNFNFDFDYNTAFYREPNQGTSEWSYSPIMLDLSYMFNYCGWSGASAAHSDLFVYNNNIPDRNIRLPKRTINTAGMFAYTVFNFNIHFDSNIVQNTSNMFLSTYFNGEVNWYDSMPTTFLLDDSSLHFDESGKINDASNMFKSATRYNRVTWMPANGVNNASNMYSYVSSAIANEVTQFRVDMASDSNVLTELPNYRYAIYMDTSMGIGAIRYLSNTYPNLYIGNKFSVSVPSGIDNAAQMFWGAHINSLYGGIFINDNSCNDAYAMFDGTTGITNSIYVGNDCAINNCSHMFNAPINIQRGDDGFIYFGWNSMQFDDVFRPPFNDYRININVKYMSFELNSGKHGRNFFNYGNYTIDQLTINNAFCDRSSNASWGQGELFRGAGYTRIFINHLAIRYSFDYYDSVDDKKYGAALAFANHYQEGEDIKRLDIYGRYPEITTHMFFNSVYTFENGIHIGQSSCLNAGGMFNNCRHMVLNTTGSADNRVFFGNENLILANTFRNCINLNGYPTTYEMPTQAMTVEYMFFNAHLYGLDTASLASMNCNILFSTFRDAIIDNVDGDISFNESANGLQYVFQNSKIGSSWSRNIYVNNPDGQNLYYAFYNMDPHPAYVYVKNMYSSSAYLDPIVSVDDDSGLNIHVGPNTVMGPYNLFKHVRYKSLTSQINSPINADTGNGTVYYWNIEDVEDNPRAGHWSYSSSNPELPINSSLPFSYDRTNEYYYQYTEYRNYEDGTYPNGQTRYVNLPSVLHTFGTEWFKNSTWNVIIQRG